MSFAVGCTAVHDTECEAAALNGAVAAVPIENRQRVVPDTLPGKRSVAFTTGGK